jgi:hypothetical protein
MWWFIALTILVTLAMFGLLLVGLGFVLRLLERREGKARGEYGSGGFLFWGGLLCVPTLCFAALLLRWWIVLSILGLFSYLLLAAGALLLLCELRLRKINRLGSVRVLLWGGMLWLLPRAIFLALKFS